MKPIHYQIVTRRVERRPVVLESRKLFAAGSPGLAVYYTDPLAADAGRDSG